MFTGKIGAKMMVLVLILVLVVAACAGNEEGEQGVSRLNQSFMGYDPLEDCHVSQAWIYSGGDNYPGVVDFLNTDTDFIIGITPNGNWMESGWLLESVSLYVGADPVPADASEYPIQEYLGGSRDTFLLELPLEVGCGGTLNVSAAMTLVRQRADGTNEYVEAFLSGPRQDWMNMHEYWAFGLPLDDGGWYLEHTVCCEGTGCTYTQGYWKNHPEDWPVDSLTIGGVDYSAEALLELLQAPVRRDASMNLAHQLIAARLNVANGASVSPDVASTMALADDWMTDMAADSGEALPYAVHPRTSLGQKASELAGLLAAYNEGEMGTIHCDMLPEDKE